LSGGQGRVVWIAGTDLSGPALDFVLDIAMRTKSLIEVLYVRSTHGEKATPGPLMNHLANMGCNFQITFLTGNLLTKMSDYNQQRQDIMAVVCGAHEPFAETVRTASRLPVAEIGFCFPTVFFIGNTILA
jgi:hypothetical protein